MMAAKGYIVFAPNRRGVSGFGQEWKEQISGDYGGKNMQDYLDATDAMAKEPYVDAKEWVLSVQAMAAIQSFILQVFTKEDSKHLFHIAECSILKASTDQQRSSGLPIRTMEDHTGKSPKL